MSLQVKSVLFLKLLLLQISVVSFLEKCVEKNNQILDEFIHDMEMLICIGTKSLNQAPYLK